MKRTASIITSISLLVSCMIPIAKAEQAVKIKNIIYMIPDGGGMAPYYLSDAVKNAGGLNNAEQYPYVTKTETGDLFLKDYLVGAITTYCADSEITDSAAAGTAMSTGYKSNIGYIGLDTEQKPHATILEICQALGKKTGMVTTYDWANATPAAFSSHNESRSNNGILSEQITNQNIDVVLGVGFNMAGWGSINEAVKRDYKIINNRVELQNVSVGDKIWGNLENREFPYDVNNIETTVTLKEMTEAAITALSNDDEGFFLMVEGSRVDGAGHGNSTIGMVGDYLAFDEAFGVALEYAKGRDDTMIIACPDHDTGGMILPDDLTSAISQIQNRISPDDVTWTSTHHTARDGGLFIYLPDGVNQYPNGVDVTSDTPYESNVIDNTEIVPYLTSLLGVDKDTFTSKLFVDVTDMGTYDQYSRLFSFNDYPASVKSNASYAYYNDATIDLNGEVCVYSNERFYVPQRLLDKIQNGEPYNTFDIEAPVSTRLEMSMGIDGSASVQLNLKNYLKQNIGGYIKFIAPENMAALDKIDFGTLAGLESKVIDFDCPNLNIDGFECDYSLVLDDGRTYSITEKINGILYAAYTDTQITVDGVINEAQWDKAPKIVCDDVSMLADMSNWKGFRDLSAVFSMLYDKDNLYFYSTVTDEIFFQDQKPENMWNADCIQFGFYNDTYGAYTSKTAGSRYDGINFGYIDGSPVAYRSQRSTHLVEKGVINDENFEMQCVHDGNDLTYEIKIPWSVLFGYEITPQSGDVFAFSFLANDNDGTVRRGAITYGDGIYGGKDVNKFVRLYLLGNEIPTEENEIKICYNNSILNFYNKPFFTNDRTMVSAEEFLKRSGIAYTRNDSDIIEVKNENSTVEISADNLIENAQNPIVDVNGTLYMPLRAFCENLGATVDWSEDDNKVIISK